MGARTNFHFKQGEQYFTLYSHWGGDNKIQDLAYAIKKAQPRWQDEGYAARIIVSYLIGSDWENETGFGLYAGENGGEESYQHTVIDLNNNTVIVDNETHSFQDFCNYHIGAALI
jgi:hypothetical protein